MQNYTATTRLANSEFVALLKQANTDSSKMAEVIGVSEAQLRLEMGIRYRYRRIEKPVKQPLVHQVSQKQAEERKPFVQMCIRDRAPTMQHFQVLHHAEPVRHQLMN